MVEGREYMCSAVAQKVLKSEIEVGSRQLPTADVHVMEVGV